MNSRVTTVIFGMSALLAAQLVVADVSEATFTPQGSQTYASESPSSVEVFVFKPDFKFKVIGLVEARGMAIANPSLLEQLDISRMLNPPSAPGEKEDIELAMKALKDEAARAGAHGVVILQSVQAGVSNGTERRIRAAAIRRAD
jgi:hypothetical protein